MEIRGERGYFGMLSIEPVRQGTGVGHRLANVVEQQFRDAGCKMSDLKIVNVRTELHVLYRRWGYVDTGTAVYDDPTPTKIPVHFITMSKATIRIFPATIPLTSLRAISPFVFAQDGDRMKS